MFEARCEQLPTWKIIEKNKQKIVGGILELHKSKLNKSPYSNQLEHVYTNFEITDDEAGTIEEVIAQSETLIYGPIRKIE